MYSPHAWPEARPYVVKKKVDGVEVDHVLSKVDSEKDLGIKVDAKLSFEQHINDKINKANQMIGLVRRSFIYLDKENFRWLYKAIPTARRIHQHSLEPN